MPRPDAGDNLAERQVAECPKSRHYQNYLYNVTIFTDSPSVILPSATLLSGERLNVILQNVMAP